MNTEKTGFTLIELIIVLTLIGMLSLLTLPLYNDHIIRVRRAYIVTTLMELAGRMEKYYTLNHTYDDATKEILSAKNFHYENYYDLNIKPKSDFYTLEFVPINKQKNDSLCGTLTLDQNGNRGISGSGTIAQCWQ